MMSSIKRQMKKRPASESSADVGNKRHGPGNEQPLSPMSLEKCPMCNRRFNGDRLVQHERACRGSTKLRSKSTHRYHYDSQMHRWKGLEYGANMSRSGVSRKRESIPKTHWREKHRQFQDAVKGQFNSTSSTRDYVQAFDDRPFECTQCQRKFATENAVTKHQKGCKGNRQMGKKSAGLKPKTARY